MSEQIAAQGLDSLVLSDIAHVEMGQSPDSRYVVEDPSAGLPFLQGNAEFGAVNPEPKFGCLRPVKTCKANDVLISVRAPVGAVNLADRDYCIGRGLAAIRGRGIKPSLLSEVVARQSSALRRVAQGTTFEAISKNDLLTLKLSLPPRTDWPKIAQILDTLDTTIHETEAIIAKLKAVKQGLLHDLLTRGIDANGELRPPQSEAPHLYKPSPLGWIPKEWEEISLGDIARRSGGHLQTGPFGSQLHANEYTVEGIPVVMPQDMIDGEVSVEHIARITERRASALARHRLKPNDVVFSRRGELSRCVAIDERQAGWVCGTGCLLARLPTSEVNAYWLALVYQQPFTQSQVMGRAVGSTMANLNTSILGAISIARPTVTEQNEIAKRIASTSMRIRTEERTLQKLRLEKAGLMDDLLTGRVRVTPLLQEAQHA